MGDQSETTANTNQPQPCKEGCGFFGSNATGDRCSKCWQEKLRREGGSNAESSSDDSKSMLMETIKESSTEASVAPTPMEVEPVTQTEPPKPEETTINEKKPATTTKPKKKKKKTSYKNMMAGMLQGNVEEKLDIEKENEKLRAVTGGGAFSKIDKI